MCRWPLACDYPTAPECWPGGTCSGLREDTMRDDVRMFGIGHQHVVEYVQWAPDRELNPQHADVPDEPRYAAMIHHPHPQTGDMCTGMVTFAGDVQRRVEPDRPNVWQVESWEPLTISPSVLCSCGDHGFIRDGRWLPA